VETGRPERAIHKPSFASVISSAQASHRRGAVLHVSGLPPTFAKEALLRLLEARSVPSRLALISLSTDGKSPSGEGYVCIDKVREARRLVGQHHHRHLERAAVGRAPSPLVVTMSSAEKMRAYRQEFLVVHKQETETQGGREASGRPVALGLAPGSPVKSSQVGRSVALGLAQTLHQGARVTGSMAAAVFAELLGAPLEPEEMD